jgi:glutathione S-transferase
MSTPKETRSPEFLALNHRGKTPVLVDGDTIINESLAILLYVEDYFAPNIPLLPPITEKTARARTLARIQETENLHRVYDELEDGHFDDTNNIAPPLSAERRAELIAGIEAELQFWEKYAGVCAGVNGFIAGDEFTLADCAFFPLLGYMLHRGFEWDDSKWPNLHRYYDRVWEKECAKKAQPDGWNSRGRANVFKATRGGAQPIYEGHGSPIHD